MSRLLLVTCLALSACFDPDARVAVRQHEIGRRAHELARTTELREVHGGFGLSCAPGAAGDHELPSCTAMSLSSSGLVAIAEVEAVAVRDVGDERALVVSRDFELLLHRPGHDLRKLADHAVDPWMDLATQRIAFVALPSGTSRSLLDVQTRIAVLDLARGSLQYVSDHPLDSRPFPIPGTDEVLVVSGRTGLASLWVLAPGREPRQLTNLGQTEVGTDFVPIPERDLVWVGERTAVYTSRFAGEPVLWSVDVDTGRAEHLGPGRLPSVTATGQLVALRDGVVVDVATGARATEAELEVEVAR